MGDNKHRLLQYGLIALSVIIGLVGAYFGVRLPFPELPEPEPMEAQRAGIGPSIFRALYVENTLGVAGDTTLAGDLDVAGDMTIVGDLTASTVISAFASFDVSGNANVDGDVTIGGDLDVTGEVSAGDGFVGDVTGDLDGDLVATLVSAAGDLDVTGIVTVGDYLYVVMPSEFNSDLIVSEDLDVGIDLSVGGDIVFGEDSLYPLGVAFPGFQFGAGRLEITGTHVATHTTGVPWSGVCTLDTVSVDAAFCGIEMATGVVTLTVYMITDTAVSEVPAWVNWMLVGVPSP